MSKTTKRIARPAEPAQHAPEPIVMIDGAEQPFTYSQATVILGADWRQHSYTRADGTLALPLQWVSARLGDDDSDSTTPTADPADSDDCGCLR